MIQVPTTQRAKMSIDPKFVELTADVLTIFFNIPGILLRVKCKNPTRHPVRVPLLILPPPQPTKDS